MRRFVAVFLVLCVAIPAQARELRPLSMRELTYRADTVVLAVPVDGPASGHFKVTKVLRGGAKVDTVIALSADDMGLYSLGAFAVVDPDNPPPAPIEAILYLAAPVEPGKPSTLVTSGLLLGMPDGSVLAPRQSQNAALFTMTAQEGRIWVYTVKDAITAAKAIDEVMRLKAVAGKERAVGLLRWVERHRLEFGGGFHDDDRTGWGSLETDVFDWMCDKGRTEDCWAAVRLYAELNHGATLPVKGPYFGTPGGRDFLFQLALNERVLDGDRARALALLSHAQTLSPAADEKNPGVAPCSDADLAMFIQKLTPLIDGKTEGVRRAATGALHAILTGRGSAAAVQMELKNALPALERVYKTEQPSGYRDQVVELIHTLGGVEHWKEVSGSKTGVAVLLRDFGRSNDQTYFWLQVLPATEKFYERPTLVLEHLDAKGKVLETKTLPLPVANAPRWEEGWTPADLLLVQFPSSAMTGKPGPTTGRRPGRGDDVPDIAAGDTWRVSVRGTVGKEKLPWTSEVKLYLAPSPSNGNERIYEEFFEK